jgi:hypothetical protein
MEKAIQEYQASDKQHTECDPRIAIERANNNKDRKSFKIILNVDCLYLIRHIYMTASVFTWNFRKLSQEQQYELFGQNIVWPEQYKVFAEYT